MSHQIVTCQRCGVKHWDWQKHSCRRIVCRACAEAYYTSREHICDPLLVQAQAEKLAMLAQQQAERLEARRARKEESQANIGLIVLMWALTILQFFARASYGWPDSLRLELLLDAPAIIFAIILVCSRNGVDKANGWVKLAWEFVVFAQALYGGIPVLPSP